MKRSRNTSEDLRAWQTTLADRVKAYLERTGMSRRDLWRKIDVHYTNISTYLQKPDTIREEFPRQLARHIPEFRPVYAEYRAILGEGDLLNIDTSVTAGRDSHARIRKLIKQIRTVLDDIEKEYS